MTPNESAFMRELRQLLRKHKAKLSAYTDYDGEDAACGSIWEITGPEINLEMRTIEDELDHHD